MGYIYNRDNEEVLDEMLKLRFQGDPEANGQGTRDHV